MRSVSWNLESFRDNWPQFYCTDRSFQQHPDSRGCHLISPPHSGKTLLTFTLSLFIPPTWKTGTITMHQVRHHPCHQGSHILVSWLIGNFTRWWPTNKVRYPVLHFSARHPTEVIALALVVKNLPTNAGDTRDAGLIPWSGRSPGGGNCNPLQYCCLENPKDRGAWPATVHGVTMSQTQLKRLNTETPTENDPALPIPMACSSPGW